MSDYLPLAVRAFTECASRKVARVRRAWRRPRLLLVLDTETTTDAAQALLFGCARVYRLDAEGFALVEEVLFHADELPEVDERGFRVLCDYASRSGLRFLSRLEFVDQVLWRVGCKG